MTNVNYTYHSDHVVMYINVESLSFAPETNIIFQLHINKLKKIKRCPLPKKEKTLYLPWNQDNIQYKQLVKELPLYWELRCGRELLF